MLRRIVGVLSATLIVVVLPVSAASASCFFDENAPPWAAQLEEQPLVFVGTAVDVRLDGRLATFRVEEVWHGALEARRVEVAGGPLDPGMVTSVDRSFVLGTRYVVVPTLTPQGFTDNSCSLTREFDGEAAAARPSDARVVSADDPSPDAGSDPAATGELDGMGNGALLPILVGTTGILALGGIAVTVRRQRRAQAG